MEITNENFKEKLPYIQESIASCEFLAIDTELSGLQLDYIFITYQVFTPQQEKKQNTLIPSKIATKNAKTELLNSQSLKSVSQPFIFTIISTFFNHRIVFKIKDGKLVFLISTCSLVVTVGSILDSFVKPLL
jgi:hypothetical protein